MEKVTREFPATPKAAGNILEQLNSVEDAYRLAGLERGPVMEISCQSPLKGLAEQLLDLADLTIICNVANEGWQPDWSDSSQYKYYPYVTYSPGSGFAFDDVGYDLDCTCLGARLYLKSRPLAQAIYDKFPDLCNRVCSYNSKQSL